MGEAPTRSNMAGTLLHSQTADSEEHNHHITINVSGVKFVTTHKTLLKFPNTRLGKLATVSRENLMPRKDFFFDADDVVFREVLRYHRTGQMHMPPNICSKLFHEQLSYWGINENVIEDCCGGSNEIDSMELEKQFLWFERTHEPREHKLRFSEHVWYFLTDPRGPYTRWKRAATVWAFIYMLMTVIQTFNTAFYTFSQYKALNQTTPSSVAHKLSDPCKSLNHVIHARNFLKTMGVERILFLFFFVEIIIRSVCCPNKRRLLTSFSINLFDIIITFTELLGIGLLQIIIWFECVPTERRACTSIMALALTGVVILQTRCARLLAYAAVFR